MTMRILTGRKFNLLERGIVTASSEHAQLGRTRLYDGRPSRAYRASDLAAVQALGVDGSLITDGTTNFGGFETWVGSVPVGWTAGTGTVVQQNSPVYTGSWSVELPLNQFTSIYRDVVVKSGESINIESAIYGASPFVDCFFVYNPLTHNYLQANSTWSSAALGYRQPSGEFWTHTVAAVTVESYAACQSDLVSLRITVGKFANSPAVFVDHVHIWPRVNFASIHGHNLDPGVGVELRSSDDAFAAVDTLEATFVIVAPSFYALMAAGNPDRRYWRIKIVGANSAFFEIGEAVIGYAQTPLQQYENPLEASSRWDRQVSVTPGGERHVHKRSKWRIRNRVFNYTYYTQAGYDEGMELFHLRPEGDTYPVVIVPDHDKPTVIHGRLESTFDSSRVWTAVPTFNDVAVVLSESPFASSAY